MGGVQSKNEQDHYRNQQSRRPYRGPQDGDPGAVEVGFLAPQSSVSQPPHQRPGGQNEQQPKKSTDPAPATNGISLAIKKTGRASAVERIYEASLQAWLTRDKISAAFNAASWSTVAPQKRHSAALESIVSLHVGHKNRVDAALAAAIVKPSDMDGVLLDRRFPERGQHVASGSRE